MERKRCRHYDGCSAQLCPMLPDDENRNYSWFPDEEICRLKKDLPSWVNQQKKVASKIQPENCGYYFTLEMLKVPSRVTKKVKGLDPNYYVEDEPRLLKEWFKAYKGKETKRNAKVSKEKKAA